MAHNKLLCIKYYIWKKLKAMKFALYTCVLFIVISGCDSYFVDVPTKKQIEIISVEILKEGNPDDFRGKALKITTSEKLERRTVTYKIEIITNNGFEVKGDGFLSSMSSPYELSDIVLENMYLWVPRHDEDDMRRVIREEVKPNNVNSVHIRIFESKKELARFVFTNL